MDPKPKSVEQSPQRAELVKEDLTRHLEHLSERNQFHSLLLANPNYFGNLEESEFQPQLNIQSSTFYEEIGCVGYQPEFERLEAVVYVKQPFGYGGSVCSNGSVEYVRFYLSHDNGATWEDLGLTAFRSYDIPEGTVGDKRLEYAVSLQIGNDVKEQLCFFENLCQVRAILSWNFPPPPNQPNWKPVWGEEHDTVIQVRPWKFVIAKELFEAMEVKIPPKFQPLVDLNTNIPLAEPVELGLSELKELYQSKNIQPQRLLLTEIQKMLEGPEMLMASVSNSIIAQTLVELNVNFADFFASLFPTDGNTTYEEMECIGYNPNLDTLVATIRVKRPFGYLGKLCFKGSREHVAFWADLNGNGTYETYLGTASVPVHDIDSIPDKGLEYAVFLPVNLKKYQRPCHEGPRIIPIRAIMSWQTPPPPANPNYVPVYGNREETLVHVKPGIKWQPGVHIPYFDTIGSMLVDNISLATGRASGPALLAGFTANQSPFGGLVVITGGITNTPNVSEGVTALKYRIEVSEDGINWNPLTNQFKLYATEVVNGIPQSPKLQFDQKVDADGYYTYQEDLIGATLIKPVWNILGYWQTAGLSGRWYIRLRSKNPVNNLNWFSPARTIRLDNKAPEGSLAITSGGGACADFTIGDVLSGTYSVIDEHFGRLSLGIQPANGGSFTSPAPLPAGGTMPLVRTFAGGVPTAGESGNWSLDTKGMPRCGYIIELHLWDRTIVNSDGIGFHHREVVGLCLREPTSISSE